MNTALELLKTDLGKSGTALDDYLLSLLAAAEREIAAEGITLDLENIRDVILQVDYAAYKYRARAKDNPIMPRHLRLALNNRRMEEDTGSGNAVSYNSLLNLPSINGKKLVGALSAEDLALADALPEVGTRIDDEEYTITLRNPTILRDDDSRTSSMWTGTRYLDKDNRTIGAVLVAHRSGQVRDIKMFVSSAGNGDTASIQLGYDQDGNAYFLMTPQMVPPPEDASRRIPTTQWVRDTIAASLTDILARLEALEQKGGGG